jgi:polar amino acid transport system ATP-binding protein
LLGSKTFTPGTEWGLLFCPECFRDAPLSLPCEPQHMVSLIHGHRLPADEAAQALVTLADVHVSYGDAHVLRGIDLSVNRSQAVSIIGPSGSGKSTILRCINGLVTPRRGEVRVGGVDVGALHDDAGRVALRKRIGFVFQQYNLFPHLSALQNLMIAPTRVLGIERAQAEDIARALLAKVRLEDKAHAYPGELSGGQQQRVAIARALAMQPELILFDEVTSALDPQTVGEVLNVIGELVDEGLTCVLVTHEMRFAEEISDRVVYTEGGVIVEEGTPAQIFHAPQDERTRRFLDRTRTHVHRKRQSNLKLALPTS